MRRLPRYAALCLLLAGCSKTADTAPPSREAASAGTRAAGTYGAPSGSVPATSAAAASSIAGDSGARPLPLQSNAVVLSPENTRIEFVGLHVGPRPDPRTGGFEKFTGEARVDPSTRSLESVTLEINTASLWTEIPKLTDHLKSIDFFEVNEFPEATFQSTQIEPGDEVNQYQVTGDLTLHGVTKEITFPVTVDVSDDGLAISSEFTINRMDFGMDWGPERVVNEVSLTVVTGEKSQPRQAAGGFGPGGGRGGAGGGAFDPAQMFSRQDANSDGKLSGDEIPEQMRENIDNIDTDGDGAITLAEFQERMRQWQAGRGAGGPGAGAAGASGPALGRPGGTAGGRPGGTGNVTESRQQ